MKKNTKHSSPEELFRVARLQARQDRANVLSLCVLVGVVVLPSTRMELVGHTRMRLGTAIEILNEAALERLLVQLRELLTHALFPRAKVFEGDLLVVEGPMVGTRVELDATTLLEAQKLWSGRLQLGEIRMEVDGGELVGVASPQEVERVLKEALALPIRH